MSDLPEPLVPAEADVRGFKDMPLDVSRLMDSTVWISLTPVGQAASINLWMRAWNQVPAGSLPDNDRVLEHFSMVGMDWAEVREAVLSKWIKCSDGRLYSEYLSEKVLAVWRPKTAKRNKISAIIRAEVLERDGSRCRYCNDENGPFHIDHVFPVSKGGLDVIDNLVVACVPCNLSKSDKTLEEWLM